MEMGPLTVSLYKLLTPSWVLSPFRAWFWSIKLEGIYISLFNSTRENFTAAGKAPSLRQFLISSFALTDDDDDHNYCCNKIYYLAWPPQVIIN